MFEFFNKLSPYASWITTLLSLIGIAVSLYNSSWSFHKQIRLKNDYERLEYVFFPLLSELESLKGNCKSFYLYWYLHDKMMDNKYVTLIKSKKIIYAYRDLENCIEQRHDLDKAKPLFSKLYYEIEYEAKLIKRRTGYENKTYFYAKNFFIAFYIIFCITLFLTKFLQKDDMLIYILIMMLVLSFICLIISVIFFISAFRKAWPFYKDSIKKLKTEIIKYHSKRNSNKRNS